MDFPELKFEKLSEGTVGEYVYSEDTIYIDRLLLEEESGYSVLFVLFHEMYHRQEHLLVELYEKIRADKEYVKYHGNSIFYDTSIYAHELHNYISADIDPGGYEAQKVEQDANYYAAKGVLEVEEKIEEYFSNNN